MWLQRCDLLRFFVAICQITPILLHKIASFCQILWNKLSEVGIFCKKKCTQNKNLVFFLLISNSGCQKSKKMKIGYCPPFDHCAVLECYLGNFWPADPKNCHRILLKYKFRLNFKKLLLMMWEWQFESLSKIRELFISKDFSFHKISLIVFWVRWSEVPGIALYRVRTLNQSKIKNSNFQLLLIKKKWIRA